jgi:hypothetical protein
LAPIYCRHDDYAFLPPDAQAGIPCDSRTTSQTPDPHQIAQSMFDQLNLPSLRIGMNPRLGMVAVPTWLWVEGYDGAILPLKDTMVLQHQECHSVVERDPSGIPVLDGSRAPSTRRECQTISDTLTVEVRAWPRIFLWNFGDNHSLKVRCVDLAACPAGIGLPFTDVHKPSPIAHAYKWSSLGANGAADAYSIALVITFGAQYRFSINGTSQGGWQGLNDRDLLWTAMHRVQEAQAVLTRPCPVTVDRC